MNSPTTSLPDEAADLARNGYAVGSKLTKAQELGVAILDEAALRALLGA